MVSSGSTEHTGFTAPAPPVAAGPNGSGPLESAPRTRSRVVMACKDIADGFRLWRLAATLGWLDIRLQFSGSTLGPFWLTLTTAIMIGSMGLIYSQLFHLVLKDYLPYLSISIILWQTGLSALILESCWTFTRATETLRSVNMPYTVQALRTMMRCGIVFSYNLVVPVVVFLIFGISPGADVVLALPALLLWLVDSVALCLLLGCACARFRDIPPIVGSVMQIIFYITPIIWEPKQVAGHAWLLYFNPFYSLLEIVRRPFLGQIPSAMSWLISGGISVVFCLLALFVFSRSRSKLAFWV